VRAKPLTDTLSPVSTIDLAQWLDIDDDPNLEDWLSVATDEVIRFTNRDLLPRQWRLVINRKLDPLQVAYNRYPDRSFGKVELPYTALISVQSVKVDGEDAEHEVDALSEPAKIDVQTFGEQLEVIYTAGANVIPASIKTAIKLSAQYLYEHAGACEVTDALHKSGAASMLRPYRIEWV
jgi:hypothetical protein